MKFLLPLFTLAVSVSAAPFEIKEGDRVLLLGDALLERENSYGHLEARMHESFPTTRFTVRNLAWSGETPKGWSRASFDPPAKGWERLKENIATVKPTVAVLGFGMAASLQEMTDRGGDIMLNPDPVRYGAEPMSAARFKKEMSELMDAIDKTTPEQKVRYILLSPIRHEDLRKTRPGMPDPAPHNALLEQYSKALEELAKERSATYCPADPKTGIQTLAPWNATHNGITLTEQGYSAWSLDAAKRLEWKAPAPKADAILPAILRKNDLYFHQFRPANSTYLFGFRKHEQGRNAAEMPKFTPLIEAVDAEIDTLKRAAAKAGPAAAKDVLISIRKGPAATVFVVNGNTFAKAADAVAAVVELRKIKPANVAITWEKDIKHGASKELLDALSAVGIDSLTLQLNEEDEEPTAVVPPLPTPNFTTSEGLEISLWADTSLVGKPVGMNWDATGRLWIACSPVYPQIAPGGHPDDKVVVLEDTDRDGKADKTTTFASNLIIAAGVAPDFASKPNPKSKTGGLDAAYIGASTELLRMEDTDGDGKADERRIVLSGFGTEDTHHTIHTLRWGPDGRLYFNQSIYIHSHMETPWGMVRVNSAAICAYDPRTERVEVHAKGWCNPWGHVWDKWGQEFVTDGAGYQGVSWLVPGAMYFTYENARKIMPSVSPGSYPKYCGLELIQSPLFPADWQGNAITCDFRAHRIVRFQINDLSTPEPGKPAQSGYVTKELPAPVTTTDSAFRPIDVKHGPDGALYIADWTNPIINHGEVDFRDPRRDHVNGRVWRVAPKGSTPLKWESLVGKEFKTLLEKVQNSTSEWERTYARHALFTGAHDKALAEWAAKPPGAAPEQSLLQLDVFVALGLEGHLAESLKEGKTTNEELKAMDEALGAKVGAHFIRAAGAIGARKLRYEADAKKVGLRNALVGILGGFARSAHPRVRVEAMRALSRIPTVESAALVLEASINADPADAHYAYAAWLSVNDLAPQVMEWIEVVSAKPAADGKRDTMIAFALQSLRSDQTSGLLASILSKQGIPKDGSGPWIELIGQSGGAKELGMLYEGVMGDKPDARFDDAVALRSLTALESAARLRAVKPATKVDVDALISGQLKAKNGEFESRFHDGKLALRVAALRFAANFPDELMRGDQDAPRLLYELRLLVAASDKAELRDACLLAFRNTKTKQAFDQLEAVLGMVPKEDHDRRVRRIAATLVAMDPRRGMPILWQWIPKIQSEAELTSLWRDLLSEQGAADRIVSALPKDLPKPAILAGLRVSRELGKKGEKLAAALMPLAGVAATPANADFNWLVDFTIKNGNAAEGELIYRRATLACTVCHAIGGAGGKVGPDMTTIGASAPLDYLVESIMVPGAKVKEGYHAVALTLKGGRAASGVMVRETERDVILRDASGAEQTVPKADITAKENIGSLMPAGLVATLNDREKAHLFAFLSQLGKPGPFDATKATVARTWDIFPGKDTEKVVANAAGSAAAKAAARSIALVDGRLPKAQLAETLQMVPNAGDTIVAVTRFATAGAGKFRLHLQGATKAWLNGAPLAIASDPNPVIDLAAGNHVLAIKLDTQSLPETLRAECADARFLNE